LILLEYINNYTNKEKVEKMEKSLLRAFLFSLLVFLALNFLFYIITYSVADLFDLLINNISDHPSHGIYLTTYPTHYFPWELFERFAETSTTSAFKIYWLGGFISFVLAAIVAGFMGGDLVKSLIGWFLTVVCAMIILVIVFMIDDYNLTYISFTTTLVDGIITVLIAGLVNALIYGVIVLLIAFLTGRSN
jgi:hypothetical protein